MTIRVEHCWGGGKRLYYRLTLPDGRRETIDGDSWTRKLAGYAKTMLSELYHVERGSIRFRHR